MNPRTGKKNTRKNTPEHCWACEQFKDCFQAQMMTKDTEPVDGFVNSDAADHFCEQCAPSGSFGLFAGEKLDTPAHCATCGIPLRHCLSPYGIDYVLWCLNRGDGGGCARELWFVIWADYLEEEDEDDGDRWE